MLSFFTSTSSKKSSKQSTAIFAGLDDPFNFPSHKMRYASPSSSRSHSRTSSPDSATDSGYGSIDDDCPLSPKSHLPSTNRRRLQKDGNGHWRMNSYEYQSECNDHKAARQPILQQEARRDADDEHEWKPNLKHTFPLTCDDKPTKPKWYTKRVYGRKLREKEKSEGVTDLQRAMAPVLGRPSPSPSPLLVKEARPSAGVRKKSTLLHPSPPPSTATSGMKTIDGVRETKGSTDGIAKTQERGRTSKPSTLLRPSPPRLTVGKERKERLRSPRNRPPTPLGIPTTSDRQPAPTPLRIHLTRPSVLHSCFSDSDSASDSASSHSVDEDDGGGSYDGWCRCAAEDRSGRNGVILARTGVVARAQRVRVRSPGLKMSAEA